MRYLYFSFFVFQSLFLTACNELDQCVDSGGFFGNDKKCVCEVYNSDGFCKTRISEIFEAKSEEDRIYIQYTGSGRAVRIGDLKVSDGFILKEEGRLYVVAESLGLFLSIPDYPEAENAPWEFEGCTVTPNSTTSSVGITRQVFGFSVECKNRDLRTKFWTTKNLNVVGFDLNQPIEDDLGFEAVRYTNGFFISPDGLLIDAK